MKNDLEILGEYEPCFLHIKISAGDEISDLNTLQKCNKTIFGTFVHEYVHFLQNITTSYGLMMSSVYINNLKNYISNIKKSDSETFTVPVKLGNTHNSEANLDLIKICQGDDRGPALVKYENYITETENILDKNGGKIEIKKYKIYFYDMRTYKPCSIYFGAICLKEYIAHAIQKQLNPDVEHNDIPYLIAELILQKELPSLATDHRFMIALCDFALMSWNPADVFFSIIEEMKRKTFAPTSVKDIYNFLRGKCHFSGSAGELTMEGVFNKSVDDATMHYLDALKANIFHDNAKWIKHILEKAKELRVNHEDFMTKLVKEDSNVSEIFINIIKSVGVPFYTNNENKGRFIPPEYLKELAIQPYMLLVFKQIIDVFNGTSKCLLYKFCKSRNGIDITRDYCNTAPWKMVTESHFCPFAQFWVTWGLKEKKPTWVK